MDRNNHRIRYIKSGGVYTPTGYSAGIFDGSLSVLGEGFGFLSGGGTGRLCRAKPTQSFHLFECPAILDVLMMMEQVMDSAMLSVELVGPRSSDSQLVPLFVMVD